MNLFLINGLPVYPVQPGMSVTNVNNKSVNSFSSSVFKNNYHSTSKEQKSSEKPRIMMFCNLLMYSPTNSL